MKRAQLVSLVLLALICSACGKSIQDTRNTTNTTDDGTVTVRVKTALINDPVIGGARIDVETFKGVVTLSGRVKSKDEEDKALALVRGVKGVTEVKSTLQIQP